MGTWNANRLAFDRVDELIAELVSRVGRRIFIIQEVWSWHFDVRIGGRTVVHDAGGHNAIFIPAEIAFDLRWTYNSEMTAMTIVGELCVVSTYFSNS